MNVDRRFRHDHPLAQSLGTALLFFVLASTFFLLIGRRPASVFGVMASGALGDGFALTETLVKTTPILLCALATALPIRLGLISVGAEGQLFMGGIAGTALVLGLGDSLGALSIGAMLATAALGAALYGAVAGALRAYLHVNETISTLLLNYVAPLGVNYLVYGPWKDPDSLGWPSTVSFPDAFRLPTYFDTRLHLGLLLAVVLAVGLWYLVERTRWGYALELLREAPQLAARAGVGWRGTTLVVMAASAALAGLAGIIEVSVIEGRLQSGVGAGAGYSGFLVAWLCQGRIMRLLPVSFLLGAMIAAGDSLQLFENLPSAVSYVLQGVLFASALIVMGLLKPQRGVEL